MSKVEKLYCLYECKTMAEVTAKLDELLGADATLGDRTSALYIITGVNQTVNCGSELPPENRYRLAIEQALILNEGKNNQIQ